MVSLPSRALSNTWLGCAGFDIRHVRRIYRFNNQLSWSPGDFQGSGVRLAPVVPGSGGKAVNNRGPSC
ncbi:hypothetical protein, partial [Caballeronia sp. M23-90]